MKHPDSASTALNPPVAVGMSGRFPAPARRQLGCTVAGKSILIRRTDTVRGSDPLSHSPLRPVEDTWYLSPF